MSANPTAALATFSAGLTYDAIPAPTQRRVLEVFVDAVASGIVGRNGNERQMVATTAATFAGAGASSVIASDERLGLAGATLLNGYQVTAVSVCDVYRPAHCHITPELVPPAIAVAEDNHVSGRTLLTALAVGLETATRIGKSINYKAFHERGWHSPGVIGPFAGAAAVASLLGLDATGHRNALGLAGSQSAGTMAQWGTPTIKFHQARGAVSGLLAGLLAASGYTAGDDVLTAPTGGILSTFSDGGTPDALTAGLGEHWELEAISLKRWPAGSGLQTMITSLLAMIDEHDVVPARVEKLTVTLPAGAYRAHGEMAWDKQFTAPLSARFVAAIVLHDRRCWTEQFAPARRTDPGVNDFATHQVEIREDSKLGPSEAVVEILLADGNVVRDTRAFPKGDPEDPLSLDEVVGKLREASAGILPDAAVEKVLDGLLHLDQLDDVAPLIGVLASPADVP